MRKCGYLCLMSLVPLCISSGFARSDEAGDIVEAAGVQGGLVVHVGCGDGRFTAALGASDGYVVQGLDSNPDNVAEARRHIQSLGLYGKVTADSFDGERLPYTDNLVNLVVTGGECQVPREEVLRVLAPGGVAVTLDSRLSTLNSF